MSTQLVSKEIKTLFSNQEKMGKELDALKKIIRIALIEEQIHPSVLKRWDRISRDLDKGKGRTFASAKEALRWLKNI